MAIGKDSKLQSRYIESPHVFMIYIYSCKYMGSFWNYVKITYFWE